MSSMEIKSQYKIGVFIIKIINLGQAEMVMKLNHETERIHNLSYKFHDSKEFRENGSIQYLQQLRNLRYFLASRRLPVSRSPEEKGLYRKITEKLIAKGEWPPDVLENLD